MPRTDEELFCAFQHGDPAAFDTLLERYRRPVFAMIRALVRDPAQAEDVFQEVFLRVIRSAGTFDPDRRFSSWLFRITDNTSVEHLRTAARHPMTHGAVAAELAPDPAAHSPEDHALRAERDHTLARAIAQLPDAQRRVVMLREFAGLPFDDIARILDAPRNTVLSHMHRALKSLRRILTNAADGPESET